jgi:hypothetical protein
MPIPAVGLVRHDNDSRQAYCEKVGDNDEDVVQTWPGLFQSGHHPDDDRERDQDDEDNVDDE